MSRSSVRRAQVEPLPALVAVTVLCLALGTYGAVRADVVPDSGRAAPTDAVLSETVDAAPPTDAVVVDPTGIDPSTVGPPGYDVAVTVKADGRQWTLGPASPPPDAATASQQVPVQVAPGDVHPGRVTVAVWS